MSKISDIVKDCIHDIDQEKTDMRPECLQKINNTFTYFELQAVGNQIIRELEGMISDSLLNKESE